MASLHTIGYFICYETKMSLTKDLLRVSGSNLVVMLSSIINGLVLPYVLSIDSFADLKTYTLYASFIGFLHLGFVDGLNIKYGGYTKDDVDKSEFNGFHNFFIIYQLLFVILLALIGILTDNILIMLVALAVLPINLQSFFLYYFQAIGEFKDYSKTVIIVPAINIIVTLIFVLIGVVDYRVYVLTSIFSYFISIILLERRYKLGTKFKVVISFESLNIIEGFKLYRSIFLSGFFIMLGNVLFTMFFDTGRWMSKFFTTNEDFAKYSLGISLIGFVMIFIGAVNKTFYPYLFKNNESETITRYKNLLYIIGSFSLLGFPFLKLIIAQFLPKYIDSLPITAVLITSIPGMMIIKSIYVNLYKVQKIERKFFRDTLIYLIIAAILNFLFFFYFETLISIALASVLSIYVWAIYPINCVKIVLMESFKEALYITSILISFYILYLLNYSLITELLVLFFFLVLLNLVFFRSLLLTLYRSRA